MSGLGHYVSPTDEQLENFVRVMLQAEASRRDVVIDASVGARMVVATPTLKAEWLRRHRELQEAISDA